VIQGQAGQTVGAQMVNATTGAAFAGAVSVFVTLDNGAQAAGSVGGGAAVSKGNGYYTYSPSAAETQGNLLAYTFIGTGAVPKTLEINAITPSQISALQTATGLSSVSVSDLLVEAAAEIRVTRFGGTLEPGVSRGLLGKLNRMLDLWNADPQAKYNVGFQSFTPTVNHAPHTLGPNSADWVVTARPDRIKGANLILNTVTPAVRIPIRIRDDKWWLGQTVQGLATSIVTDLFYSPDWPNGNVNLWPVPTATYPIELMTDTLFGNLQSGDVLWLPFGYREAITLSLAVAAASSLGQTASDDLKAEAMNARVICFSNNRKPHDVRTRDGGMPGGRRGGRFLYRTGRSK